jgi:hypothetical protein
MGGVSARTGPLLLGGAETSPPVWMRGGPSQLVLGKSSSGLYPQVLVSQTAMSPGSHYACGGLIAFAYW